jgi:hypothetical protein
MPKAAHPDSNLTAGLDEALERSAKIPLTNLKCPVWASPVIAVMSAARPLFAKEQTFAATHRTAVSCRVEMWRGGCRLNISVAASFV